MNELLINLEGINPAVLWGPQNDHFEIVKKRFPKLKLVTRGTELKVIGEEAELNFFTERFGAVLNHVEKYNSIKASDVDMLLGNTDKNHTNGTPKTETENAENGAIAAGLGDVLVYGHNGIVVRARTANQKKMATSADVNDIIFAIGPAGTGKTYTAVALAVRALKNKEIKRIILTRPAVEAGESLGFLPGDLKEKIDPYLRPLYDALDDMIAPDKLKLYLENRTIEIAPLAFMRGRTLDNAFVILDEAQNATDMQLKMFLTRMGPSAKFILTGDVTQIDLPVKQKSCLVSALKILNEIKGIDIIHLNGDDVVRHKLVRKILEAYGDLE